MSIEKGIESLTVFDDKHLGAVLGVNEPLILCDFYNLYLRQVNDILDVFVAGAGLERRDEVARLSHKLKSSSLSVGAAQLGESLERLELACRDERQDVEELVAVSRQVAVLTMASIVAHVHELEHA